MSTTKRKQVTINGVPTIIPETTNSGATYDTTDLIKDKIVAEDGTEWFFKQVKDGDVEQSNVVEGVTTITYIYEKATTDIPNEAPTHELPEGTIEELDPVEEGGSVTAHFVDTNGNVIKDPTPVVTNVIVNTIERTKITVNGESSVKTTTTPSGETYDATTVRPQAINFDGKVYEYVEVHADSASENGTVPVGQTDVTFVYRHVPQITTREETSQVTGDVIVKYVDTEGNEIKPQENNTSNGVVSNTTTTITLTDGVETNREDDTVPTGLTYDTTPQKLETIDYNGDTYRFKQLKDGDKETSTVVEGTTVVTYIYERVPVVETREETSQVKGNVVVKYVDTEGNEIKTPVNLVTEGIVSNTTTTITVTDGTETGREDNTVPTGLTYDSTTEKPETIDFNGSTYRFKQLKDGDVETANVVEGTTTVTYVYEREPRVSTREETSQVTGDVVVKYVDTNGVEIKNPFTLVDDGVVSNTTTTITTTDGVETGREDNTVPTGLTYDSTTQKPTAIDFNGDTYNFKQLKDGDNETGNVIEGTTTVTYIYEQAPKTTTETTTREVYGNVVTRYVNEVTGQEIVSGSNIITGGLVATETTTTVKDAQGGIVSQDTVRTPSGLTYDTTADKAQKDAQIATMRTTPTHYTNTATGELLTIDTPATNTRFLTVELDVSGEGWVESEISEYADNIATGNGYSVATRQKLPADTTRPWYHAYKYTKAEALPAPLSTHTVPYEFTRVDISETGDVEEGTKVITYYYKPSTLSWTPAEISDGVTSQSVATLARDF